MAPPGDLRTRCRTSWAGLVLPDLTRSRASPGTLAAGVVVVSRFHVKPPDQGAGSGATRIRPDLPEAFGTVRIVRHGRNQTANGSRHPRRSDRRGGIDRGRWHAPALVAGPPGARPFRRGNLRDGRAMGLLAARDLRGLDPDGHPLRSAGVPVPGGAGLRPVSAIERHLGDPGLDRGRDADDPGRRLAGLPDVRAAVQGPRHRRSRRCPDRTSPSRGWR